MAVRHDDTCRFVAVETRCTVLPVDTTQQVGNDCRFCLHSFNIQEHHPAFFQHVVQRILRWFVIVQTGLQLVFQRHRLQLLLPVKHFVGKGSNIGMHASLVAKRSHESCPALLALQTNQPFE